MRFSPPIKYTPDPALGEATVDETTIPVTSLGDNDMLYVVRYGVFGGVASFAASPLVGWPVEVLKLLTPTDAGPLPAARNGAFVFIRDFWGLSNNGWFGVSNDGNLTVAYTTRPSGATQVPAVWGYIQRQDTPDETLAAMNAAYARAIDLGQILRPSPGLPTYITLVDDGSD